jgi:hypothetical protein
MTDWNYIARHAEMLITLAEAVADASIAACLLAEATDLTARIDDSQLCDTDGMVVVGTCNA